MKYKKIMAAIVRNIAALAFVIAMPHVAHSQTAEPAKEKPREIIYQEEGGMLKSTDGGRSWKLVYSKRDADLKAAQEAKQRQNHAVIFTSGNNSYRSEDGGRTWKMEATPNARKGAQDEKAAKGKTLLSFFPQPLGNNGQARITLKSAADVALVIYDQQGQKVAQPIDSYMSEGEFTLPLDFTMLSSGSYTYTLTVGAAVQSGSLVVVK